MTKAGKRLFTFSSNVAVFGMTVLRERKCKITRKSGGAPVSHWLPVSPEPQSHTKLPGVFMHEPPLRQPEFPDVDAHSSMSKIHMHIKVLLPDCN